MQVEIRALACRRGGRMVFRDIDFLVKAGQAAVLRGPNGVGKSTLLRVLAGLLPVEHGEILMASEAVGADMTARQDRVAYAGHLDAVKPALTVAENLNAWSDLFDSGAERVDDALSRFGLDALAGRPAAQCSAGQKRRLGLARLLVADRAIWLLDEPTVSLDAAAAALVGELVAEHCAGGGAALIATHIDLDLPPGPVLDMVLPAAAAAAEAPDAFLTGDWA